MMRVGSRRWCWAGRWASALGVALALACAPAQDDDPVVDDGIVETPHLRIISHEDDKPICAGTGPFLERELLRIAQTLELPLWSEDEPIEVHLGPRAVEELCRELDDPNVVGCAPGSGTDITVAANGFGDTPHELVHAVRLHSSDLGPALFEEGLAQVLSGTDGYPLYVQYPRGTGWPSPAELIAVPYPDFDGGLYAPAQSFISWLWLTYGRSMLMALVNDPRLPDGDAAALFQEHYGISLDEANQGWTQEDAPDPVWGDPCLPERTYTLDGALEWSGKLDCSDPETIGATISMSIPPMCMVVPETTRVRITFEADHGRLSIVRREPCDLEPTTAEALRDKFLEAGEVREEDIVGCRFWMYLASQEPGFPTTEYAIRVEEIAG